MAVGPDSWVSPRGAGGLSIGRRLETPPTDRKSRAIQSIERTETVDTAAAAAGQGQATSTAAFKESIRAVSRDASKGSVMPVEPPLPPQRPHESIDPSATESHANDQDRNEDEDGNGHALEQDAETRAEFQDILTKLEASAGVQSREHMGIDGATGSSSEEGETSSPVLRSRVDESAGRRAQLGGGPLGRAAARATQGLLSPADSPAAFPGATSTQPSRASASASAHRRLRVSQETWGQTKELARQVGVTLVTGVKVRPGTPTSGGSPSDVITLPESAILDAVSRLADQVRQARERAAAAYVASASGGRRGASSPALSMSRGSRSGASDVAGLWRRLDDTQQKLDNSNAKLKAAHRDIKQQRGDMDRAGKAHDAAEAKAKARVGAVQQQLRSS